MPPKSTRTHTAVASTDLQIKELVEASRPAMLDPSQTLLQIPPQPDESFDELEDVERITKQSRAGIYALMAEDEFPKPVRIKGRRRRRNYWLHSEVVGWVRNKAQEYRDGVNGAHPKQPRSSKGTYAAEQADQTA